MRPRRVTLVDRLVSQAAGVGGDWVAVPGSDAWLGDGDGSSSFLGQAHGAQILEVKRGFLRGANGKRCWAG
jgi:hypothetical protein